MAELNEKFGNFRRENFIHGNTPSIEAIQRGELARPETCDVSMNLWNRSISLFRTHVVQVCSIMHALASISRAARLPVSKACRPAAAIMAALSVQ